MFNDEFIATQGLEENIYTDMPEQSETEYKYASKTDRQQNQAYIIAKKNEAAINALARKVVDISNTISGTSTIQLENAYEGALHRLEIVGDISILYPSNDLYPSDDLYPIVCNLLVDETTYDLDFEYLNYISSDIHDTYIYQDGKQWVERNVGIDEFGNKYALSETIIEEGEDITIFVKKESEISMVAFDNVMFRCIYLLDNEYTSTFANQAEVNSELNLLGDELEAKVSQVTDENGNITSASLILAVNNDTSGATLNADKISLEGKTINMSADDINITSENLTIDDKGRIELTDDGQLGTNLTIISDKGDIYQRQTIVNSYGLINYVGTSSIVESDNIMLISSMFGYPRIEFNDSRNYTTYHSFMDAKQLSLYTSNPSANTDITANGITTPTVNQTSKEEFKKNFEKIENGLDIIKNIDIYEYNLKTQEDGSKKHIGFIIGDKYKYDERITSENNDSVDIYSFVSVCCKAIQEQQEQIEQLKQEINLLKERNGK